MKKEILLKDFDFKYEVQNQKRKKENVKNEFDNQLNYGGQKNG